MRRTLTVSSVLAFVLSGAVLVTPTTSATSRAASTAPTGHQPVPGLPTGCSRTYTLAGAKHAAQQVYRGTHKVTTSQRRMLSNMQNCQLRASNQVKVAHYFHKQRTAWKLRVYNASHPFQGPVTASWFDDSGATSCGTHAQYGFATLMNIPCGSTIEMRGPGGAIVKAVREDSGPYVSGRTFDLNPGLKAALGCGDLCSVYYRYR